MNFLIYYSININVIKHISNIRIIFAPSHFFFFPLLLHFYTSTLANSSLPNTYSVFQGLQNPYAFTCSAMSWAVRHMWFICLRFRYFVLFSNLKCQFIFITCVNFSIDSGGLPNPMENSQFPRATKLICFCVYSEAWGVLHIAFEFWECNFWVRRSLISIP